MKQKVSLIRSFLMQPDFVMMDEPFKSIDIASKKRIIQHILQHYPDITLLLVTHNLDEIPY
jgi:ABC-type nitrate/sulfonate/bicarbonate transport system ATPase subunit